MSTAFPQDVREAGLDNPDRLAAVTRLRTSWDAAQRPLIASPGSAPGVGCRGRSGHRYHRRSSSRRSGAPGVVGHVRTTAEPTVCVRTRRPSGEPLLVADARSDPRFHDNLGVRELGVAGYAGSRSDGQAIGAFSAFDDRPRTWTTEDLQTLEDLAAAAMTEVELRATAAAIREATRRSCARKARRSRSLTTWDGSSPPSLATLVRP